MEYLIIKWIHILSSTILFGTGVGTAFFMFMANRRKEPMAMYFATRHAVLADWLFTTPAVIVQMVSGLWLLQLTGISSSELWVASSLALYFFAGGCWLPVVWMQIQMRDMAKVAVEAGTPLPDRYWKLDRWWITLGALAFPALVLVFYLMVAKP
jgi:uncharacterized membrane protein